MDYLIKRDDLRDCHWADAPVTDLADGMARLRVDAFALTANNVTYGTLAAGCMATCRFQTRLM